MHSNKIELKDILLTAHNLQFLVGNQFQTVINTNIIQMENDGVVLKPRELLRKTDKKLYKNKTTKS